MMIQTRVLPLLVVLLLGFATTGAAAIELAPHRAFYELHLNKLDEGSGIAAAEGALAVDWSRSCEGWTVDQRLALDVEENSGERSRTEIVFSSFESLDGLTYSFISKTTRNGRVTHEYRGEANREQIGGAATAHYTVPEGASRELPAGTVFPMEHLRLVLNAAARGENRLFRSYFDGPRPAESPFGSNALILGGPLGGDEGAGSGLGPITEHPWWPVRIAFFPSSNLEAEPDFELAANLQDNGVVRRYLFDYGAFQMAGDLARIEAGQVPICSQ